MNHPDHPTPLIAPTSLLTFTSRAPRSTLSENFNPRYFQPFREQRDFGKLEDRVDAREAGQDVDDECYNSTQRHLQEMVVRNTQRAKHSNQVPLLRRGGHVTQQELYTDLTKDIMPRVMGEGISFEDEDLAALRIQSMYRGKLGKKRYEAELEGWKRRDRAALRVQCAWRGRQGYSKMLLMRAKKYDEDEAAILLQSMMRAKHDRKRYIHTRAFMSQQEIMATRIQCAYRGRRDRLRMQQRRREKGSLIATTTQWGESENGLALLVDLGGFKTKYSFNNVMTVKGQGPGAKVGLGASSRGHRMNERHLDEPSRDEDNIDDDLLEELKGESSSLAKQLARIEVMAEELEEDFARTGSELHQFKKAMGEGLRENSIRQLNSRMNLVDYENEMIRKRQAEKDKENRKRALGDGSGGGKKKGGGVGRKSEALEEAEQDMQECWDLIGQLQKQLY